MRPGRRALAALAGGCVVLLGACGGGGDDRPPPVAWHESSLPAPAGSRSIVRDASYCGGLWYVVGATATASGQTRPAVWASSDAARWKAVPLDPDGDYYSAQAVLGSVGCSRGRIAALGAKAGGAHGMPRTRTWRQLPDGSLVAVPATFTLFGGVKAVDVNRLEGGPRGFLIAGTRSSGAAVWRSPDGRTFRIEEGVPGLASHGGESTQGFAAAWHDDTWWAVGTTVDHAGVETGLAWTPEPGGSWQRHPIPGDASLATAERAAETPHGLLVVGLNGDGFGAWTLSGDSWSRPTAFGSRDPAGTEAPYVSGLAVIGDEVGVSYSDGSRFRLAVATGGGPFTALPAPEAVPVNGDHQLAVVGGDGRFLLVADDGQGGRVSDALAPG